jgi:hypothetical protein
MSHEIHKLYVHHLLNGGSHVKSSGGSIMTFVPAQQGSGWFTDKLKAGFGHVKNFANNYIKPLVVQAGKDTYNDLRQGARGHVRNATLQAFDDEGSIRDRLRNAANTVKTGVRHDLAVATQAQKRAMRDHILNSL